MKTKKDLLELKNKIDEAKANVADLKGELKFLMKQLKTQYDCDNEEDIEDKLKQYNKKIKKLQEQKDIGMQKLQQEYEKINNEEE